MAMAAVPPRGLFPSAGKEHRTAITVPEFKRWVKQFDTDHDGRISRKELQEALRRRGVWFSGLRAQFAIRRADRNHDGFLDDSDIEGLIEFAERELGFMIATDDDARFPPSRPSSCYGLLYCTASKRCTSRWVWAKWASQVRAGKEAKLARLRQPMDDGVIRYQPVHI